MNNKKIFFCFLFLLIYGVSFGQNKIGLDEAIRITIENNQQIKSSRFSLQREEAGRSRSYNIPKLKLFVEYEGVKGSLSNYEERKIGLSQDFEFPTVYFNRAAVQNYQVEISGAQLENTINILKSNLKENYARLIFNNNSIQIARENLKFYEEFVFTAERKYQEGAGSNLELLGARVNRIKFENLVKNFESEIISSGIVLKSIMNTDYTIEASGNLSFDKYNISKEAIVQTALLNNPELRILKLQKLQSDSKISLAVSEALPNFSLRYYSQKIGGESGYYGFEAGVGIPLWFWWEPTGNIRQAKLELKSVSSNEINLAKIVESQVYIAYESYQNSLRQLNFFTDQALEEAEEIIRTSKISYEEGAIGYTEYLQALNIGNETRTQYLEALYNYNLSIINLERLTGKEIQ
ncbi:MAG: TolC family protein [Bacteroidota bacterium]|nr:TolC family protein [Bacteroidota bacterium]